MTKLLEMRKKRGIRPSEIARRLNITRQCVCLAERKGIRNSCTAVRYAAVLNCNPGELMEFSIQPK